MRHLLRTLSLILLLSPMAHAADALDRIAAVVDDDVVLESEVQQRTLDVRHQMAARGQTAPADYVLRAQIVDQLILQHLQRNLALRAGVRVDDNTLTSAVSDIARQNHLTLDQFRQQLNAEQPGGYAQIREQIRNEMTINRYRNRKIGERIRISDQDIDNFLNSPMGQAALESEYHLAHILISVPEGASPTQLADARSKAEKALAELRGGVNFAQVAARYSNAENALDGGDLGWRKAAQLPTLFAAEASRMQPGDFAGPVQSPAGFHVLTLIDKRGAETMSVHQRQVRHILIKPSEILTLEDAQQKAEDIRQRLEKGAEFAELARTYSEDPGSARNGGDLGWVSPGEMVPSFEEMMNKTPVKGISPVFESQFGWHILQVLGERDQDMTKEYRRNLAKQALYNRKFDEELPMWLREIRAEAYVEIKDVAKAP